MYEEPHFKEREIAEKIREISKEVNLPRIIRKYRRELKPYDTPTCDISVNIVIKDFNWEKLKP
jgi:hypothetical protein